MKCDKCGFDFEERELDLSHDVPRYLFQDKNEADKHGRRYLCKKCHDIYERVLMGYMVKAIPLSSKSIMICRAKQFARWWFNEKEGEHDSE